MIVMVKKILVTFGALSIWHCCTAQNISTKNIYDTTKNIFNAPVDTISEYLAVPSVPRLDNREGLSSQFLDIGNVTLYVQTEGKGIPLVLLHGGPGATSHYFHPWFKEAAKFCKLIYYDQRGCGLSEYKRDSGYNIDQSVEDLENLRKKLKINKWIVLGHSYGGYLAQYYCIKHPESVLGLILVSASVPMDIPVIANDRINLSDAEQKKIDEIWSLPGNDYSRKIYNAFLNGDWKRQNYYKPTRERCAQIALYEGKSDTVYNFQVRQSMKKIDLDGYFFNCPIPTLITEGRWDMLWLRTKIYDEKIQHPNAELVWFENSSHSAFRDEPHLFFSTLQQFIKKIETNPAPNVVGWNKIIQSLSKQNDLFRQNEKLFLDTLSNDFVGARYIFSQNKLNGRKTFSEPAITSLALNFRKSKEYDKAIQIFELAIEAFPNSANLYEYMADTYASLQNRPKALENYKKTYRLNPYRIYLLEKIKKYESGF